MSTRETETPAPRGSLSARRISAALGGRDILRGVDLDLAPGQIVGLVGANGAGKSTLLRVLGKLLPPSHGEVRLDGTKLETLAPGEFARKVAYVPQQAVCHWPIPGRTLVELGRLPHGGRGSAEDDRAVHTALEAMEVSHLAERPATEVSGGELRRLLIARALATEPTFLLLDEPTAGLDPYHQLHLLERLRFLAHRGHGVLVTLHDLALAARFCDRITVLHGGSAVAEGPPAKALSPAVLRTCYGIEGRIEFLDTDPVLVARLPKSAESR